MTAPAKERIVDGRFALEVEHKRGGMGTVWRARDLRTERPVAVKILHPSAVAGAERFAREATLLADLAHGSIVSYVADGVTAEGVPYLAMEWLEGETVAERLARGPLGLADSLRLVAAAARALAVAHERAIVHRDLKPSNLFLRRGQVDDVVVLDLGIARHVDGGDALTRAGTILGTPSYMAPEQAQGLVDIGPAADVFSLGCVLFECLTGAPPFVGDRVFAVLAKVLFDDPPRLPEVPRPVEALIERLLAKDPARRPANAAALLAALAALPEAEPAPVGRAGAAPPPAELELVSVILATADPDGGRALDGGDEASGDDGTALDLSVYGGERRRLADGTTIISLPHRRGAATDLAVRAARLALRLRERAPGASIVLATGRGLLHERSHIGEVVDRAGTMLRDARAGRPGGAVWIDDVTAGLLDARFRVAPVAAGLLALEGEEPTIDPTRPLLGRPTACVGRDHELATLQLMLRVCVDESSPRAVLVVGPPGLGKTRLRHELVRRAAHEEGLRVLVGLGDPIRTSSGGSLLGGALARFCGLRPDAASDGEAGRALLEERLGPRVPAAERRRAAVFLGELCGLRQPPDVLPELRVAQRDPRAMARFTEEAWLAYLRAEAAAGPILLVLDDLQWSDARTIALVDATLRKLESSPVLVLALARPEVTEIFPGLWAPHLAMLPLRPLPAAATARLVRQALGDRVAEDGVQRIVARAAGNALFAEELIRAAGAGRDDVPETVVAMLQARIGLLPGPGRRVLRAASVFGESFPVDGVAALVDGALAAGELEPTLAALAGHEIIEHPPDEPGGARWRFRHALMRDAAYGLFTDDDRRAAHRLAARHLAAGGEDDAVIAGHHLLGGEAEAAVARFTVAAGQAQRRGDHGATIDLIERGKAAGATGVALGALRCLEAPTRFFRYDFAGSWAAVADALALVPPGHRLRNQSLAAATFFGLQMGRVAEVLPLVDELMGFDPDERERDVYALALGLACLTSIVVADRPRAARLLERLEVIDALGGGRDLVVRGQALFYRGVFGQYLGADPYATFSAHRAAADHFERIGDRRLAANARVGAGEGARRLYSIEEGKAAMRAGVAAARLLDEAVSLDFLTQFLTRALIEHGADDELEEARRLTRAHVERPAGMYRAFGLVSLALLELRDGDLAAAEAHAREARDGLRGLGQRAFTPVCDTALLRVLVAKGDPEAGPVADEALALVDEHGPMGYADVPLRLEAARAHRAVGRTGDAARGVAAALALVARQAAGIPDAAMRDRFLHAIPENVALGALADELGASA